jgi:hypothetical protein
LRSRYEAEIAYVILAEASAGEAPPASGALCHQSPFGYRFTTCVRLRIMNRPVGFSAIATANAARARASARQVARVRAKPEMRKNGAFCASLSAAPTAVML